MTEQPPPKIRYVDFSGVEFLEGISDLDSDTQVAVYTVVFATIYARGGPIANDAKWLNRSAKCRRSTDCRAAIDELLAKGKLYLTADGLLMNGRSKRALEAARHRINGLSTGPLAAKAKWQRRGSDAAASWQRSPPLSRESKGLADTHHANHQPSYESSSEASPMVPRASRPAGEGLPARAHAEPDPSPKPKPPFSDRLAELAAKRRTKLLDEDQS